MLDAFINRIQPGSCCQAFRCLCLVSSEMLSVLCRLPSESDKRTACRRTPWKYDFTAGEQGEVNGAALEGGHAGGPDMGCPCNALLWL